MQKELDIVPSSLGPADHLVHKLLNSIALENTNSPRWKVLVQYMSQSFMILGPGAARWVAKFSSLLCADLNTGILPKDLLCLLPTLSTIWLETAW